MFLFLLCYRCWNVLLLFYCCFCFCFRSARDCGRASRGLFWGGPGGDARVHRARWNYARGRSSHRHQMEKRHTNPCTDVCVSLIAIIYYTFDWLWFPPPTERSSVPFSLKGKMKFICWVGGWVVGVEKKRESSLSVSIRTFKVNCILPIVSKSI